MNQQNPKKEGGAGASVKAEMAALGAAVFDPPRVLGMMADWGVKDSWFADEMARRQGQEVAQWAFRKVLRPVHGWDKDK